MAEIRGRIENGDSDGMVVKPWEKLVALLLLSGPLLVTMWSFYTLPTEGEIVEKFIERRGDTRPEDVLEKLGMIEDKLEARTDDRFRAQDHREFVRDLKEANPKLEIPEKWEAF